MRFARPKVGRPSFGRPSFGLPKVDLSNRFSPVRSALASVPRPGARFAKIAWLPAGVAIATVVVLVSVFSGTVQSTDSTLVLMGFDPDRAQLITALIVGGTAAAAVTLVVNRTGFATVLGTFSLFALFAQTFVTETRNAVGSTGLAGNFDMRGWVLTVVTLVVIGVIAAWIGATLGASVRPGLIGSGVAAREMVKARRPSRRLSRGPTAALLVIVLLAVTVPAFGDMVNLSPDALMLNGEHGPGLVPGASFPHISPIAEVSATPSPSRTIAAETPTPKPSPGITAAPGTKPWLAWKPTGAGQVVPIELPAPWKGGTKSTAKIDVYTPPGYDTSGDRRYPVLYEAPTGLALWGKGTSVISTLDTMIDSGEMPATIVVFIDSLGSPYGDTQCADMYDGSQWFETYISQTVVEVMDKGFRTIADSRARGIMGMSAGGFCAPMLVLRHPDVFSISISFSGYFTAGAAGPTAVKPFGDAAGIQSHSPVFLAGQTADVYRSSLYFVVIACQSQVPDACPKQEFYASHAAGFEKVLKADGFSFLNVNSPYTHGWAQVRYETPGVLRAWGARLVVNGIW
jgi:S-formylglutathione hydrolase FrmB